MCLGFIVIAEQNCGGYMLLICLPAGKCLGCLVRHHTLVHCTVKSCSWSNLHKS